MDVNFRLKRKARGTRNPLYLSPNWGYFVHPDDHEDERKRVEAEEKDPDNEKEKDDVSVTCLIEISVSTSTHFVLCRELVNRHSLLSSEPILAVWKAMRSLVWVLLYALVTSFCARQW